ncbi:MAG: coenzyme F420-0:L-glutamate ligase [Gammaproteobacteria bacterium]|nr:MAG: coenzyme F420-0:L-glutamate ligase [Gammaproteobacteria bacterium]
MIVPALSLTPLPGLPAIRPGDDLASLIAAALDHAGLVLADGDVLAVTQKIVSKAEGRLRRLADVQPSAGAQALAVETRKDPRLVELILQESREVLRTRPDLLIAEHRLGIVLANAGIDRSNLGGDEESVLLLPEDPDASAARLRQALQRSSGAALGIVITDSVGRAWRRGTVGIAIGTAGVAPFTDLRGRRDLAGRPLQVSEIAPADSLAAAAVLVMGEAAEGTPVVLIRGAGGGGEDLPARAVLRPRAEDLFR